MLRIAAGRVYDPANGIAGEVRDVCVQDGKIVTDVPGHARRIDARGMVVMPGGVDIHAHIAGPAVNAARKLATEEPYGGIVPSTFATAVEGIEVAGTAHRMDGVPVPLRALMDGGRGRVGSIEDVLAAIAGRL